MVPALIRWQVHFRDRMIAVFDDVWMKLMMEVLMARKSDAHLA